MQTSGSTGNKNSKGKNARFEGVDGEASGKAISHER